MARRGAFLDRDGVITALVPDPRSGTRESPYVADEVRLEPSAVPGLRLLRTAGFALCVASNQPSAAKGFTTLAQLDAVEERARTLLESRGLTLDAWRRCPHHPEGTVPELALRCQCRKPAPGMILDMARTLAIELGESWMIGDSDTDVQAGRAAGCRTVLITNPGSAHRRPGLASPDGVATDLAAAATFIAAAS